MMLEFKDELVYLVSAANIAGYMEHADKIEVPSDDDLAIHLVCWINEYEEICEKTDCGVNYFDYIEGRIAAKYGV